MHKQESRPSSLKDRLGVLDDLHGFLDNLCKTTLISTDTQATSYFPAFIGNGLGLQPFQQPKAALASEEEWERLLVLVVFEQAQKVTDLRGKSLMQGIKSALQCKGGQKGARKWRIHRQNLVQMLPRSHSFIEQDEDGTSMVFSWQRLQ